MSDTNFKITSCVFHAEEVNDINDHEKTHIQTYFKRLFLEVLPLQY